MSSSVKPTNPFATPVAATFEERSGRGAKVPYFPPPPTTTTADTKTRSSRQSKPPPLSNEPLRLPFTTKKHKRQSTRHVIGYPTQARKKRLQEVILPPLRLSPRHWTLISLLILSFVVLILGFIYADCVALPHTDNHTELTGDDTGAANVTLFVRDNDHGARSVTTLDVERRDESEYGDDDEGGDANEDPPPTSGGDEDTDTTLSPTQTSSNRPTPSTASTPAEYLENESKELGFTSSRNLAILFFYSFTLPLLTILHTIIELTALFFSDKSSKSDRHTLNDGEDNDSDRDSISKMKTLNLAEKYGPSRKLNLKPSKGCLGRLTPFLPAISLTTSIILPLGWFVINTIQAHCEIPLPSTSASDLAARQRICPVQIRGHSMHGINELSVVKNVAGWVLLVVYVVYAVTCAKLVGVAGRKKREEARLRELEGQRERQLRESERRNTIVRFSLGVGKKGGREADREGGEVVETVEEVELDDDRRNGVKSHARVGFAV